MSPFTDDEMRQFDAAAVRLVRAGEEVARHARAAAWAAKDALLPTTSPARYAKGQVAVRCPSSDGYKTRAARLAEHVGGRYSNREYAYIMSPTKAEKLLRLHAEGRDASPITGELYPTKQG